jgi:hypothetical protein
MMLPQAPRFGAAVTVLLLLCAGLALAAARPEPGTELQSPRMEKRWLFFWTSMGPAEIARFPQAQRDGYNGIVFPVGGMSAEQAMALRQAAEQYHLDLYPCVMDGSRDPNMTEGLPVRDSLFVAGDGVASFQPDNPTLVTNAGFEDVTGNQFRGWELESSSGTPLFADHEVVHGGKTSVRIEPNGGHCVLLQPVRLQAHRQYRASIWAKSEGIRANRQGTGIAVIDPDSDTRLCYENTGIKETEDWTQHTIAFNSLGSGEALISVGVQWGQGGGRLWLDDLRVEEMGLVNVVRRPGCPVTVRGENGTTYTEGKDFEKLVDPKLMISEPSHEMPTIKLTPGTRIRRGERLRVSYYHPAIIYDDRLTSCLSEPAIFDEWEQQVREAEGLLHPKGFFMQHDELRVADQCALCQSRHMTPGELLADNVHKAAAIIRKARADAEIYVWSDMFDPMHNAKKSGYYLVNGSLEGSWKGLDKDVVLVNWYGELMGKNSPFFAKLGLRQILSGYYDGDEDGSTIAKWREATKNVPGIIGAMYTTWHNKYGAMDVWAEKAWGDGKAATDR